MRHAFFLPILGALLLAACSSPFSPGDGEDFFYVKRDNARFPVWVRGDKDDDTFVVIVHGGPGSTGTQYFHYGAFAGLESQYGVVYWEERASGYSQGNGKGGQENLNAEETARDLEAVVDVIQSKYSPKSVFLLGHSWGGVLGTAFLGNNVDRRQKVDGWIEVSGGHNWELGQELSVAWVQSKAHDFIDDFKSSDSEKEYWQEALDWYDANPVGEWEDVDTMQWILRHVAYVEAADGYFLSCNGDVVEKHLSEIPGLDLHRIMPFSGAWAWFTDQGAPLWESQRSITTDKMDQITLPSLIVWGRHDGILPVALAQDAYDRLGTPVSDKSIVIFENSAHSPMFEERDAFNSAVSDFIERYKK